MSLAGEQKRTVIHSWVQSNPVIMQLLRRGTNLTILWRLVVAIALVGIIGSMFYKDNAVVNWIVLLGGITVIATPFWGAWTAANFTCLAINSQSYEFLYITTLSNAKLLEGYIFSTLYRLRMALILMLVSIPSVLIRLTDTAYNKYNWCIGFRSDCQPPSSLVVFHWFLVYFVSIIAAIGVLILGIFAATVLALWWRNRYIAGFSAALLVGLLTGCFLLFLSVSYPDNDPLTTFGPAVPYTLMLYAMAFGLARMAVQTARPMPLDTNHTSDARLSISRVGIIILVFIIIALLAVLSFAMVLMS